MSDAPRLFSKRDFLVAIPIAVGLAFLSQYHYLLFHALAELFSIVVSLCIFTIMLNCRRFLNNNYLLFLASSFLFLALLQVLHMLSYEGMPIFPEYGPNLATQFWIAARYLAAGSFLLAPLLLGRRLNLPLVFGAYSVIFALLVTACLTRVFPDCFVPGSGLTLFKKMSEYLIAGLLIVSIGLLYHKRKHFSPKVLRLLVLSLTAGTVGELTFTFYISTYGVSNLLGHFLMILSTYFIYKALVETGLRQPYDMLFRSLKQSEKALRDSEERFASFMQYLPACAYMKDTDGRMVYINRHFESTFNIKTVDWAGKNDFELWPVEVAQTLRANDLSVLSTGQTLERIETAPTPRGLRTFLSYKFPIEFSDKPTLLGGVSIDITQQEETERELRRLAEDLARSNQDLEQFAYVASHDLQEPLRVIRGYLQLIERRYKDQLDSDAREFIEFAVDGAGRMQTLISSLLAYSRVGRKSKPDTVDCAGILDEVQANLRAAVHEADAVITNDDMPVLYADRAQLVQLFQNLIGNALKFRRADDVCSIHVGVRKAEGDWLFSVSDNGIGIETKYQEKIFKIFQRLHAQHEYAGAGIGLAICKKIVEYHGGRIWVKSAPGEGTSFYFTVPDGNNS